MKITDQQLVVLLKNLDYPNFGFEFEEGTQTSEDQLIFKDWGLTIKATLNLSIKEDRGDYSTPPSAEVLRRYEEYYFNLYYDGGEVELTKEQELIMLKWLT